MALQVHCHRVGFRMARHPLEDAACPAAPNELVESQRGWVDPCNNFLFSPMLTATIGYFCRGRIPVRSSVNGWLPVPGWTGEHEWQGDIPFEELPKSPSTRKRATSPPPTTSPVSDDYPHYIAVDFTPEFRVKGVTKWPDVPGQARRLLTWPRSTRTACRSPSLAYLAVLPGVEPSRTPLAAIARERLLAWDGSMDAHLRPAHHLLRHA